MRLLKLNTMVLALICSLLIESVGMGVYYWLGSTYGTGTFIEIWCGSYLFLHKPAIILTQIFFPANHWPGVGAHILFYTFALCECWIVTVAVIWSLRRFNLWSDEKNRPPNQ
jgi:hypothetical protein